MYNAFKNVEDEKAGKFFESDFVYQMRKLNTGVVDTIDTTLDASEGTDFLQDGLPIDITASVSQKNHMIRLNGGYTIEIPYLGEVEVRFGIRTGNNRHMFQMPVLVIGFDLAGYQLARFNDAIISALKKHWDEISEIAENLYWEFDDAHPGFIPS